MRIRIPALCQAIAVASYWLSRAPAALLVQLHSGAMRINQCLAGTQDSCALHRHLLSDRVLTSTIDDLYAGRVFYEKQGEGLGEYFFDTLFSDIDSLALYAGIHPIRFGHYRLLSRRFPYAVYYMFEGDVVVIRRVLDLRRNPLQTRRKLAH